MKSMHSWLSNTHFGSTSGTLGKVDTSDNLLHASPGPGMIASTKGTTVLVVPQQHTLSLHNLSATFATWWSQSLCLCPLQLDYPVATALRMMHKQDTNWVAHTLSDDKLLGVNLSNMRNLSWYSAIDVPSIYLKKRQELLLLPSNGGGEVLGVEDFRSVLPGGHTHPKIRWTTLHVPYLFTPIPPWDLCSPYKNRPSFSMKWSTSQHFIGWWSFGFWLHEHTPTMSSCGFTISASLEAYLGSKTLTGIPGVRIPTTEGVVGTCGNCAGSNGGGGTCSGSEALARVFASACPFSNLATATTISRTVSNSWLISSQGLCWSSLARNCSSHRACYSSCSNLSSCSQWGSLDRCRRKWGSVR